MSPKDPTTAAARLELLEAWWRDHSGGVRATLRSRGATPQDVDDVVGETFARATLAVARGHAPRHPGAWLRRIAVHALSDLRTSERSQADRAALAGGCSPANAPSAADDFARHAAAEATLSALAGLPPAERDALEAHALRGMPPESIARAAGTSAPAMRRRLGL